LILDSRVVLALSYVTNTTSQEKQSTEKGPLDHFSIQSCTQALLKYYELIDEALK
jgi:hypothetical protein